MQTTGLSNFEKFQLLTQHYHIPELELLQQLSETYHWLFSPDALPLRDPLLKNAPQQYGIPLFISKGITYIATNNPFSVPDKITYTPVLLPTAQLQRLSQPQAELPSNATLMENLLIEMVNKNASDAHLHRSNNGIKVFFRVSGKRIFHSAIPPEKGQQLCQQLKYHSHMALDNTHSPQDGQLALELANQAPISARVASLPCFYGEEFAIRRMGHSTLSASLEQLGFSPALCTGLRDTMRLKSGMVLVTGPTGSGKTTTLYACINDRLKDDKPQIVSLEDPIECPIKDVRQSQINLAINYDFQAGLKALLRHDPDIIFIGEIRDKETAKIALEAAYTGHLVISSLHTSDAKNTLIRLLQFGCDPFMLCHALKGVISQQLIPKPCASCSGEGCFSCHFNGDVERTVQAEWLDLRNWEPNDYNESAFINAINEAPLIKVQ